MYHCSIAYLACYLIRAGGIVISCDSEVINARQDMEEGGTCEGKRSGGWKKVNKKRRNGESIYLHGRHLAAFLTNSCMLAYERHCMVMCTCIIQIVNLQTE